MKIRLLNLISTILLFLYVSLLLFAVFYVGRLREEDAFYVVAYAVAIYVGLYAIVRFLLWLSEFSSTVGAAMLADMVDADIHILRPHPVDDNEIVIRRMKSMDLEKRRRRPTTRLLSERVHARHSSPLGTIDFVPKCRRCKGRKDQCHCVEVHTERSERTSYIGRVLTEMRQIKYEEKRKHPYRGPVQLLIGSIVEAFIRGGSFIQTNCLRFIHTRPLIMSVIARDLAWCIIYIWATTLASRSNKKDSWQFTQANVSQIYFTLEQAFLQMATFDYIIHLLGATSRIRYVVTLHALIDVVTIPVAEMFVLWIKPSLGESYSFYFGWIRFLRLLKIDAHLSCALPWLTEVKRRIISLVTGAVVIVLIFASAIFLVESPYDHDTLRFDNIFHFSYYAIVTISTVGYGDFSPTETISRMTAMIAIITTFLFLPSQVQRLLTAIQTSQVMHGVLPRKNYLCITGPIRPSQLIMICREIAYSFPGSCNSILVVTPLAVNEYKEAAALALTRGGIRVAVRQCETKPSVCKQYYENAVCVFVVGDIMCQEGMERNDLSFELCQQEEDHRTLYRFLGAQQICWPRVPVSVQLHQGFSKYLAVEMGADNVLCQQHIKMRLMGKAAGGCPGFMTLVGNWFLQPLGEVPTVLPASMKSEDVYNADLNAFFTGSRYQLYRMEFPQCFQTQPFSLLAPYILRAHAVFLIGVVSMAREFYINPVSYIVGEEGNPPFAGIVLAPSLRHVIEICNLTHISTEAAEEVRAADIRRAARSREARSTPPPVRIESRGPYTGVEGIQQVDDVEVGLQMFRERELPLVVICGWPRALAVFLRSLCRDGPHNSVVLSPTVPKNVLTGEYKDFSETCVWVQGSALDPVDLVRAGALKAVTCVIFSTTHVVWRSHMKAIDMDMQAVIAKQHVAALYDAEFVDPDDIPGEPAVRFDSTAIEIRNRREFEMRDDPEPGLIRGTPLTITELKLASNLQFIDFTDRCRNPFVDQPTQSDDKWDKQAYYTAHPEYTAGRVFVEEMLSGQMAFSISISKFAIDASIIDHLVDGPPGHGSQVVMESLPSGCAGMMFGVLYQRLLYQRLEIPLGVYRPTVLTNVKANPIPLVVGEGSIDHLVIGCPMPDFRVREGDRLYIFKPCPEALLKSIPERNEPRR